MLLSVAVQLGLGWVFTGVLLSGSLGGLTQKTVCFWVSAQVSEPCVGSKLGGCVVAVVCSVITRARHVVNFRGSSSRLKITCYVAVGDF